MQLEDMLTDYWLARRRDLSKATIADYELTFRRLRAHLGNPDFARITGKDVNTFLNDLKERGLSTKTILNHWIALSALWTYAHTQHHVEHVIRDQVRRPRPREQEIQPYSEEEVQALLTACQTAQAWDSRHGRHVTAKRPTAARDRAIILVFVDCGLRASELTGLTMADYDRRRGQLIIRHGKGNKRRTVFLGDVARLSLTRYLAARGDAPPAAPLFATREGTAMNRVNVLHLVVRLAARAGVAKAGLHRFRHTFAITYLRNGGNVLALQQMLGHANLDTVKIYAKLAAVDLERTQQTASPADRWRLK